MGDKSPEAYRKALVEELKKQDGLLDNPLEAAFLAVPRHLFLPDESLETAGLAAAARLAAGPGDAMGIAKSLMARSFETSMTDMFAYEGFGQVLAMASGEFREGLDALLERRKPDFRACANRL